ncbi:MAG: mechanosensitive ion channel family protein [Planctomycetaceae bacterium]|jgi:MscS family membrane protein|nr:mechanosensitive ion channel family protein [Planctomycetaceae bacterium]MBT6154345.1 mechanosensitive ion channel family protein [Planctomycetaceae bacterium]MBT6484124.1 mechanosensitive ion channel family protein [Planctomycetaceae bacterium]MBT6496435.1 mechanosensitive ion channel family protein [Planctomycetaceae bacterium]
MSGQQWNRGIVVFALAVGVMFCLPQSTFAQPAGTQTAPKDGGKKPPNGTEPPGKGQPAVPAEIVIDLTNARATMKSFLAAAAAGDHAKAARAIDFDSMVEPPENAARANLAFKLAEVIKSLPKIKVDLISDDPKGQDVLLPLGAAEQPIEIVRGVDGEWRFSANVVGKIEALYVQATAKAIQKAAPTDDAGKNGTEESITTDDPDAEVAEKLDNARETMQTFLTATNEKNYALASGTMDFSLLGESPTDAQQRNLAWKLKEVIDRMQWVDYQKIPSSPDAEPFLFPVDAKSQPIVIAKGADGNWRFTRETVARIDALYDQWKDKRKVAESLLPSWSKKLLVAGNEVWRIMLLFGAILASLIVARLVRGTMQHSSNHLKERRPVVASFIDSLGKSLVSLVLWVGVWVSFHWLVLDDVVRGIVDAVLGVLFVLAVAHVLYRLVDAVDVWIHNFADKTETKLDDMLAPLARRSLRTTIVILALVQIASILSDKPPASILAGLGVASIAIGLAAQDTIKNVFGSIMLLTDRPFEVGDRVVVDGHDGPVESIGFRSTRIRTLEGHLVTVSNGELANKTIQNIGKRQRIRRTMDVTITYDTDADKIERAVAIIKEILEDHEGMHADFPPRVYFNEMTDTSLNIFVVYWYHPPDYWAFAAFNERVNLQIFRRFAAEGIEFAFPTQTLFLAGDPNRPLNIGTAGNGSHSNGAGDTTTSSSERLPVSADSGGSRNLAQESSPAVESAGTDVDAIDV